MLWIKMKQTRAFHYHQEIFGVRLFTDEGELLDNVEIFNNGFEASKVLLIDNVSDIDTEFVRWGKMQSGGAPIQYAFRGDFQHILFHGADIQIELPRDADLISRVHHSMRCADEDYSYWYEYDLRGV